MKAMVVVQSVIYCGKLLHSPIVHISICKYWNSELITVIFCVLITHQKSVQMVPKLQSFIFESAAFPNRSEIRIKAAGMEFSEAINSSQWERPAPDGFLIKFDITFEGKLQVPLLLLGEEARRDHFHLSPVTVVVFKST